MSFRRVLKDAQYTLNRLAMGPRKAIEEHKREVQQRRLVQELPWLWAIRSSWYWGWNELSVRNWRGDGWDDPLRSVLQTNDPRHEFWIHVTHRDAADLVLKVDHIACGDIPKYSWARRIGEACGTGNGIKHIVWIMEISQDRYRIVVYRHPKSLWSFNPVLAYTVCRVEGRPLDPILY